MIFAAIIDFILRYKRFVISGALVFAIIVGGVGGCWYIKRQRAEANRQAIAEAVTKGIQSNAREKEIETVIENKAIEVGASEEEVAAAKDALKKAREDKKQNVTADDILNQLNELDDK